MAPICLWYCLIIIRQRCTIGILAHEKKGDVILVSWRAVSVGCTNLSLLFPNAYLFPLLDPLWHFLSFSSSAKSANLGKEISFHCVIVPGSILDEADHRPRPPSSRPPFSRVRKAIPFVAAFLYLCQLGFFSLSLSAFFSSLLFSSLSSLNRVFLLLFSARFSHKSALVLYARDWARNLSFYFLKCYFPNLN
jgi:hypothetical protein